MWFSNYHCFVINYELALLYQCLWHWLLVYCLFAYGASRWGAIFWYYFFFSLFTDAGAAAVFGTVIGP